MSKTFTVATLKIFLEKTNATIENFKRVQEILMEQPALSREALNMNYGAKIEGSVERVIFRLNSNFFYQRSLISYIIPFCQKRINEKLHTQLDMEQCLYIKKLIENDVSNVEVLKSTLAEDALNSSKFSCIMRVASSYNCPSILQSGFVLDLIYIASKIKGHEINVSEISKSLLYLEKGNSIEFDSGISVSVAKNGNLTLKIEKTLVEKLNATIPDQTVPL